MRFIAACFIASTILLQTSFAQTRYTIQTYGPTPEAFTYLLLSNKALAANDTLNEQVLDLVEPALADSVIERKKQHHKLGPLGWFIHAFAGFNWRAVSMHKEKFVGTVYRHSRSGEEEFTEYDINFDLRFHLKKYLWRVFDAYDRAKKYHKQDVRPSHKTNYDTIPYVRDTNFINNKNYRLHCELTPPAAFRPQLNYLFFPTLPGYGGLKEHPNFEIEHPTMGFYGVFCNDCNHNCGPELHPYEWVWWLKAGESDESEKRVWHLGLFHEGSNRMKKWSVNPLDGRIKIPFAVRIGADSIDPEIHTQLQINVERLNIGRFVNTNTPTEETEQMFYADKEFTTDFGLDKALHFSTRVSFSQPLRTKGLRFRFTELNFDAAEKILSGYLEMTANAIDLYTTRITFNPLYEH
ncbi:MAG: hypothetical protein IPN22_15355 [Bacteroidetes bacterium]|nr:hypothetical protein [Bacteroidota bacterium]